MEDDRSRTQCESKMDPIETPTEYTWSGETHYVCFNDQFCYFKNGWDSLLNQGVENTGHRCRMDAEGACGPMAVWSS